MSDKFIVKPKVFSGLNMDCKPSSSRKHALQIFGFSVLSIFVLISETFDDQSYIISRVSITNHKIKMSTNPGQNTKSGHRSNKLAVTFKQ